MTAWRLIVRSLVHYRRIHLAVALGVMAGAAVLTGALLVGDSVRGSLRDLALERLGPVDAALVAPQFFREELSVEVSNLPGFGEHFSQSVPAIMLRASLARNAAGSEARGAAEPGRGFSGRVTLLGVDERFWQAFAADVGQLPSADGDNDEILLNQTLADELGARIGDEVVLRLPEATLVPRESTLGRKSDFVKESPLRVVNIIPSRGAGGFGLQPNQQLPLNAFAALKTVQRLLDQRGKANALLVMRDAKRTAELPRAEGESLLKELRPQLADYGVKIERVKRGARDYFNLTTDRMLFEVPLERAALTALTDRGAQQTLTYLANYLAAGPAASAEQIAQRKPDDPWPSAIPYSTVTAIDFGGGQGGTSLSKDAKGVEVTEQPNHAHHLPVLGVPHNHWTSILGGGPPAIAKASEVITRLADDEIALNAWAYDNLNLQLRGASLPPLRAGDEIRLTYFEPEHPDGKSVERTAAFKLRAVFPLVDGHPAHDREFTPTVRGVTDRDSIANWDAPFEYFPKRIRKEDDQYWVRYRATPKAFVSLAAGQRIWGSKRFGQVTTIRVPPADGLTAESLAGEVAARLDPPEVGFVFRDVKRQALAAATGTTPFSVLFMSFSCFIIAAAVMLVAILFRLGVEQRAAEIGTLLASGFSPRRVRRLLAIEGLIVAGIGGLLGTAAGAGYAAVMLHGLRTWWVQAISTPFLTLHASAASFVIGYASGVMVSFAAVWWTLWRMRRLSVRRLLAGQATEETNGASSAPALARWIALAALALGGLLIAVALTLGGMARAGAFFGSGFAVLAGLLVWAWTMLRGGAAGTLASAAPLPLARLAARNGARNPSRSTLTIGLMAAATFLIVALSVFQIDPSLERPDKATGNGGFALVAESGSPIVVDLNERSNLAGLQDDQRQRLAGVSILGLRVQPGEDASCRNLYQTARPRVLGAPRQFLERGGFAWAGSLASTPEEKLNPWRLLDRADEAAQSGGDAAIPVVLDANTAQWSLHLGGSLGSPLGATFTLTDDWGRTYSLQVVGLLSNSIFQGDVLMSEEHFLKCFPAVTGKQFFLAELAEGDDSAARASEVRGLLEQGLAASGFDAESTADRLSGFLAVQNTYLSTFQSLGALGLLLGTFGLATVQLRSVLERRGELALLRAAGFRRRRLAELVLTENSLLLVAGLLIGTLAALAAVLPHVIAGGSRVPWASSALSLGVILVVGLAAGLLAVRATLRAPLIQALRGE